MKEYVLFIGCLYYLSVHFHSCCFHILYHGGIREITFIPVWTHRFILCSILLTRWRNLYTKFVLKIQKGPDWIWPLQSTICSNAPKVTLKNLEISQWNVLNVVSTYSNTKLGLHHTVFFLKIFWKYQKSPERLIFKAIKKFNGIENKKQRYTLF